MSPPQAPPEAKAIPGRRLLSPAGGDDFGHLRVQNGHFLYIFKGLVGASKKQKDAHLKMRSIGANQLKFGQAQRRQLKFKCSYIVNGDSARGT